MNYFLVKTEPGAFSIDDLEREGETVWDGGRNLAAAAVVKAWRTGDRLWVYHSGRQKAIVGMAEVISEPFRNPTGKRYSWAAKVRFMRKLPGSERIGLAEIIACGKFNDFALLRQTRLSVMKCPEEFVGWVNSRLKVA